MRLEIKAENLERVKKYLKDFPKEAAKNLKKNLNRASTPILKAIRSERYSSSGVHSAGRSKGSPVHTSSGTPRPHLKSAIKKTVKVRRKGFGVLVAIGPKKEKNRAKDVRYIAHFLEHGTARGVAARKMMEHAFKDHAGKIEKAFNESIDQAIRKR